MFSSLPSSVCQCFAINKIHNIGKCAYGYPSWSLFWIVWVETLCSIAKRNYLRICVTLVPQSRLAVIWMNLSLFVMVVCVWSCPGRCRTCPASWNQVHSLAMTLLADPTVFAKFLCVCPDSSLSTIGQAMDLVVPM